MNREEAIKWLKAIEKKYIHGGDEEYDNLRKIALHMAMESLEQPEPRWIPVSERPPEERQEILATTTDNAWGDVVIIRTYYKEMHKSVIAWMPLPELYKERREEHD